MSGIGACPDRRLLGSLARDKNEPGRPHISSDELVAALPRRTLRADPWSVWVTYPLDVRAKSGKARRGVDSAAGTTREMGP